MNLRTAVENQKTMQGFKNKVLIVSDIDGSLIDHPHWGNATHEHRSLACKNLIELLKNHRVCLCTGRSRYYYESLQQSYAGETVFPWCLVAEFGAEIFVEGELFMAKPRDPCLIELEEELRSWAKGQGIPIDDDPSESSVEGICFEPKRQSLDIDWNFGEAGRDGCFMTELSAFLEKSAQASNLRYSCHPEMRRINVCSSGFLPKVSVWPELRPLLGNPESLWVFGDEKVDVDMFHALKGIFSDSEARFVATHSRVKGDINIDCGVETIGFIRNLLASAPGKTHKA
ncbi:MAG: hypothetical protein A2X49_08320 [Lentisphaerae bacterium GWF2_52_8]|nr:MAG: hypothetical protein A2X49_08320 [Lentisphaerae bacterium GWF2_52_8]